MLIYTRNKSFLNKFLEIRVISEDGIDIHDLPAQKPGYQPEVHLNIAMPVYTFKEWIIIDPTLTDRTKEVFIVFFPGLIVLYCDQCQELQAVNFPDNFCGDICCITDINIF